MSDEDLLVASAAMAVNAAVAAITVYAAERFDKALTIPQSLHRGPDQLDTPQSCDAMEDTTISKVSTSSPPDPCLSDTMSESNGSESVWGSEEAAALNGIHESLERFNRTICGYFQVDQSRLQSEKDSQTKAQASQRLHELETYLDFNQLVALDDLFNMDVKMAGTYSCLKREGVRKLWVRKRLIQLGFPQE